MRGSLFVVAGVVLGAGLALAASALAQDSGWSGQRWDYCTIVARQAGLQAIPRISTTCDGVDVGKGYPLDAVRAAGEQGWHLETTETQASANEWVASYWLARPR